MRGFLITYLFTTFSFVFCQGLQCKDEKNQTVDWFVLYKIPKLDSFKIPHVRKGVGYMYITSDSQSLSDGWVISSKIIFDNTTSVGHTLAPYYKNNQSEVWLFYNDQPPGKRSSTGKAHAKGVLGGNRDGGFWLIHSVPHYPSVLPKYAYPSNGVKYGQSFMCISLSTSELDSLGSTALNQIGPRFYDTRVSQEMSPVYPGLAKLVSQGPSVDPPYNKKFTLTSSGSNKFQAFAKSKKYEKDIYEWVAEDLQTDLLSETWMNELGPLPSECSSTYKVMNIRSISFAGIEFNSTHDHSKWAAASNDSKSWVCIGDINRAKPQEKRGGGTVCFKNNVLWKNYHILSNNIENCSKNQTLDKNYNVYTVE